MSAARPGEISPEQSRVAFGIANVIALIGQAGEVKPPFPDAERFIDRQYLQAAGVP